MKYPQARLEQLILASIEHFSPINRKGRIYKAISHDIEQVKNAVVRQHLRVLLQRTVAR